VQHFSCCDQFFHRAGYVFNWYVWIDPVLVIQIDAVGPEALQGSLNQDVAMIFLSAAPLRDSDRITLYEGGASDYISGPIAPELLRAKVRVFADLGMRLHSSLGPGAAAFNPCAFMRARQPPVRSKNGSTPAIFSWLRQ
jgi:hypothetical protein